MSVAAFKRKRFYNVDPTSYGRNKQQKHEQRKKSTKVSVKDTRTTFLLLTLTKFYTSFGGLKRWYGATYVN